MTLGSGEYRFEALRLRKEKLCPVPGNEHFVFKTDSELSEDVDPGFVAVHVPRCFGTLVPVDEIIPFVPVHPDPVSEPVREVLVAGTVAGVGDDRSEEHTSELQSRFGIS